MFDLGLGEMLVIAVLVIVFVGPDGLPDLMRVLGRFYGQMRRASDDLRRTFNAEVARVDSDRRRDELRQRRLERERARAAAAEADGTPLDGAAAPHGASLTDPLPDPEFEPSGPPLLPPDPRLPPDAAPRALPGHLPGSMAGSVPRPTLAPVRPEAPVRPAATPAAEPAPRAGEPLVNPADPQEP